MQKTGIKKAHITLLKTELIFIAVGVILVAFTAGFLAGRERSAPPLNLETGFQVRASAVIPQSSPMPDKTAEPTLPTGLKTNINTADKQGLMELPGIGEVIAGRIIDYRNLNGGFKKVEDILNVSGIGDKTFDKIRDLITIDS